jgi:hypothetical protein
MGKGYQQHLPLGYWPLAMQPGWQAGQNGTVNGMEAWSLGQTERCLLVPHACRRAPCAHSSSTSWLVDRWRRVLLAPTTSVQGSKAPRSRVPDKTRQNPIGFSVTRRRLSRAPSDAPGPGGRGDPRPASGVRSRQVEPNPSGAVSFCRIAACPVSLSGSLPLPAKSLAPALVNYY